MFELWKDVCEKDFESPVADVLHEGGTLHHVVQVAHAALIHLQASHPKTLVHQYLQGFMCRRCSQA